MADLPPTVFVIGGTGAQGIPVVKSVVADGRYSVRILTRDTESSRAKQLNGLSPSLLSLQAGTFTSESDLRAGFHGSTYAFINIDGFNTGEKTEMYWATRAYELALVEGIKFFVYGNLDYVYKKSGYRPEFRTGHYDGKGRIGEWILEQTKTNRSRMGAALFTTGPYIQMALAKHTPMSPVVEYGTVVWRVPLGEGAVAHVDLNDCGHYVRWLFDNQERANGMDLEVAIDLIDYHDMARAFTAVTGKPARYENVSMEEYWESGPLSHAKDKPAGYSSKLEDPATMSLQQNFTGFWNMWAASGGNKGVIRRNLALLDEIHPHRTRSVEDWFRKEQKRGMETGLGTLWDRVNDLQVVLKLQEDMLRGEESRPHSTESFLTRADIVRG